VRRLTVLMPLPARDVDPTEAGLSWQIIHDAGHEVVFATPDGRVAQADSLMLSGEGLDCWSRLPGLRRAKALGLLLRADRFGRAAFARMAGDPRFLAPLRHDALDARDFDALLLPGGHAKGMRPYLESAALQRLVVEFFETPDARGAGRPVGAVCHGVLLAARSISPRTGRSVLSGRRTTALTWALERAAWRLSSRLGRTWEPDYYRTYPEAPGDPPGHWSVESEVRRALASPADFVDVAADARDRLRKTSGLLRDRPDDDRPAWVVRDGHYLSARWPGDVHTFARRFVEMLAESAAA